MPTFEHYQHLRRPERWRVVRQGSWFPAARNWVFIGTTSRVQPDVLKDLERNGGFADYMNRSPEQITPDDIVAERP